MERKRSRESGRGAEGKSKGKKSGKKEGWERRLARAFYTKKRGKETSFQGKGKGTCE